MNKYRLLGFAIILVALVSCTQKKLESSIEVASHGWKTYTTTGFSIQFPEIWGLDDSDRLGMALQLVSPKTSPEDSFRENVNLVVQDLSGQSIKTLDQYTRHSTSQIKTMMTNSDIRTSERLNRDGQDYQRMVFKADEGEFTLLFEQYYQIKGKRAYVLTLTCEADSFDAYSSVGEKILKSFTLN